MIRPASSIVAALLIGLPAVAQTSTFSESFSGGSNHGKWSWGTGNQVFSPLNGNPGAFLQDLTLNSCCPAAGTFPGTTSLFTGDYRAKGVSSIGIDLITLNADFGVGNRPLSLILSSDNGTPFNFGDDTGAFFIGPKDIPDPGVPIDAAGWTDFDFAIDADSTVAPLGWVMFGPGTWSDLITDVDQVDFFYGDPTSIFIFLSWDVGLDNARITFADCNGNQLPDSDDIQSGFSLDLDLDGTPDECQPLSADTASISLSSGGAQNLAIDAGAAVGGDTYWVFGSATGTSPGVNFGGVLLPLNFDAYFNLTLTKPFLGVFSGFLGVLQPDGTAQAALTIPSGADPGLAGVTLYHAYVTAAVFGTVDSASNAIPVTLTP